MTNDELLDCVGAWAETIANIRAAAQLPMTPQQHLDQLLTSLNRVQSGLNSLLTQNGRDAPVDFHPI